MKSKNSRKIIVHILLLLGITGSVKNYLFLLF